MPRNSAAVASVSTYVIDALIVESLAVTACAGLAVAARRRRAPIVKRVALPPLSRLVADLPGRHRREARAIVELAREHVRRHPDGSADAFTAREALRTYLPDTITAYLHVPRGLRRTPRAGGPSPDDELRRQFATLRHGLERLRDADADAGASHMSVNGAFLNERFGPAPERLGPSSPVREFTDMIGDYLRRL